MSKHRVPMYFYPSLRKLTIPFIDRASDSYRFLLSIKCINMTTMMLVHAELIHCEPAHRVNTGIYWRRSTILSIHWTGPFL